MDIIINWRRKFSVLEPLFLDVTCALKNTDIKVIGGRYGLGGKEFIAVKSAIKMNIDKCCVFKKAVTCDDFFNSFTR